MKKHLLSLFVLITFFSCKDSVKEDPAPKPPTPIADPTRLFLDAVSGILDNSVIVVGKALDVDEGTKDYGFVYSKKEEFDINNGTKVSFGTTVPGILSSRVEGFEPDTEYNGKFYLIKKDNEVVYSAAKQFKTLAQGTWASLASMPVQADFSSVFIVDDLVYIVPGMVAPSDKKLYVYDLKSDKWSSKGDLPFSTRYHSNAFSYKGKGYVMLGTDGDNLYSDVWEYNPADDKWTKKANCPVKMSRASGFLIDGTYYVLREGNNDYHTYAYDIESDTWTKKNSIYNEWSVRGFGNSFVYNGIGYIFNSDDKHKAYEQFAAYDPKADSWSYTRSPVPGYVPPSNVTSGRAETVMIKDKVYISVNSTSILSEGQGMYTYDMKTLTWEKIGTFPKYSSIGNGAVLTNYNDRIFLNYRNSTYLYIPVQQ
ncbi:Kelch repeat-containing protein [Pontibacter burrus]|uniref:Galactose oxidase n=1 Tax=Pontibacter burrus TaxID=2704466 RepID=A0A6B3LU41_9BACT|nr:hypothetical protein [Pontibacter burrus]NEM97014.1 hypothetical protein [Pontibacter burrus]